MGKIQEIVDLVKSKKTTAEQEVKAAIARAQADENNAVLEVIEDRALARAKEIDQKILAGETVGRLAGVPFIAKDNFLTFGSKTTAASKILENFEAPLQATAIEKLEAEGAICIGKANLDSFAHGGSTENSAFGVTSNAHDKERVAGGSSGGSAVAVAQGIVPFALGTDTGGSIRQPSSFNGVVGYKPSYGMISRYGVVAMASSTDVIGPIATSVEDVELLCDIMAGQDNKDSTLFKDYFAPVKDSSKKKIGVIKEFLGEGVDDSVRQCSEEFIHKMRQLGHEVEEVSLPMAKFALPIYYVVVPAEVSSNLARYDGVRYGLRSKDAKTLADIYGKSRDAGFVDENKRRIMIGSYVLSSGFFDAYYLQAQKARTLLIQEFDKLFENYDFLFGPVAPTPAYKIGENTDNPIKMYMSDVLTVPASLAGLPALSLPNGTDENGLPIGAQIIGKLKSDAELLAFAREVENA